MSLTSASGMETSTQEIFDMFESIQRDFTTLPRQNEDFQTVNLKYPEMENVVHRMEKAVKSVIVNAVLNNDQREMLTVRLVRTFNQAIYLSVYDTERM